MAAVVSYGGGTNSAAMLIGLHERGERPDLILFSDTGGEKPYTYEHISIISAWAVERGFPPITTIRRHTTVSKLERVGTYTTLEEECLAKKALPSVAYGFKACSQKYKIAPQEKFCNSDRLCLACWAVGGKVQKLIGIDAGESHRKKPSGDPKYENVYPLVDWGWEREDCVEAIARAGLPQPGKSACFFCPNSKPREILALSPDLQARAIAMEENANLTHIAGLGRDWSWKALIKSDTAQMRLFPDRAPEMPCGCYDGE